MMKGNHYHDLLMRTCDWLIMAFFQWVTTFLSQNNIIVLTGPNNQFRNCEFYDQLEQFYKLDCDFD